MRIEKTLARLNNPEGRLDQRFLVPEWVLSFGKSVGNEVENARAGRNDFDDDNIDWMGSRSAAMESILVRWDLLVVVEIETRDLAIGQTSMGGLDAYVEKVAIGRLVTSLASPSSPSPTTLKGSNVVAAIKRAGRARKSLYHLLWICRT